MSERSERHKIRSLARPVWPALLMSEANEADARTLVQKAAFFGYFLAG